MLLHYRIHKCIFYRVGMSIMTRVLGNQDCVTSKIYTHLFFLSSDWLVLSRLKMKANHFDNIMFLRYISN